MINHLLDINAWAKSWCVPQAMGILLPLYEYGMIGFLDGLVFAHDSFLFGDKDLSIPIDMKLEKLH
jgi:hypothetical protein